MENSIIIFESVIGQFSEDDVLIHLSSTLSKMFTQNKKIWYSDVLMISIITEKIKLV